MNVHLAPTYQCLIGSHAVLWHRRSNNYSIVESAFLDILKLYLNADDTNQLVAQLQQRYNLNREVAEAMVSEITKQLEAASETTPDQPITPPPYQQPPEAITKHYRAFEQSFGIRAQNKRLLHYMHPPLAHLEVTDTANHPDAIFDISEDNDHIYLYVNEQPYGSFPKADYHLLQGRFVMLLLGLLHKVNDQDWMASFHASTVAKNGQAAMLLGASGRGKTTLTALLACNGFELVSDDVTGMLSHNLHVYSYPAALSVKSGAFNTLQQVAPQLAHIAPADKHPKGLVKFLPIPQQTKAHYPCQTIIMVQYSAQPLTAQLQPISTVEALQELIPDTWLSPQPAHAQAFLDWLPSVKAYTLQYHHHTEAIKLMEAVLNH